MKSVIETFTNVSIHLLNDNQVATLTEEGFTCDDLPLNTGYTSKDYSIIDVENPPEDWRGRKYIYNGGEWTLNPNDEAE